MVNFIPIMILDILVLTCAFGHVQDNIFENEHFQEMIEKYEKLNMKLDTLMSTNMQLTDKVEELFIKNNNFETEISAMRKENLDLRDHIETIQKQNKKCSFLNQEAFTGKKQLGAQHKKFVQNKCNNNNDIEEVEKRILVSDPQNTHSLELKLQDLNTKVDNNYMKHTNGLNSLRQNLQSQITDVLQRSNHGNIYIRWGRTTCPGVNGTELVYSGYSGGSWYDHYGAASNNLCMPKDPAFLPSELYVASKYKGFVFGVEYEEYSFNGNNDQHDVPCVVCKSDRTAIMMIPARQHCDNGWTFEYSGFLVSGASVHKAATEYVCLDGTPETEERDIANANGALFYQVFSKCGSLPCSPYQENGPLPCVVCSK